ncbi:hypothetical protein, partial [Brucella anthropi]|uniref:hypothetical protein n=1 Tax=Brucella anthropi TaxID=529 RepID=UPI001AEF1986
FKTNAICASENFDAFMELSFSQIRDHKWKIPVLNGLIYWEHVRPNIDARKRVLYARTAARS